jgi:processive 1,2-diacylglycerol beta-glucosyltransferase
MALLAWHSGRRPFAALMTLLAAANAFSTVYLGIHWVIDVAAGLVVGLLAYALACRFSRRWAPIADCGLGIADSPSEIRNPKSEIRNRSRRVLIVAMSVGGGHGKAGQAIAKAIHDLAPDCEVKSIDLRDHAAAWFRTLYVAGYLFIVRRVPWLWGWLYRHPPKRGGTLPPWLLKRALRPFERLVRDWQPDAILATQITASEATAALCSRGIHRGATATVVTDFDAHPSWRSPQIDFFFVPDEDIRRRLAATGIPAERLVATGVPIDPIFEQPHDASALKAKHGVRPGVPVVLLMGGSLGLGPMEAGVRELLASGRPMELLVVAGHNARLRQRLEALQPTGESRLHAFGFIDFVVELMAVSDIFVSKPGGLSMTEAVTIGVPTLAIAPLAGQEVVNARHLAAQGVVECLKPGETLPAAVQRLLADPAARQRLSAAARAYAPRSPARQIAERLIELISRPSSAGSGQEYGPQSW